MHEIDPAAARRVWQRVQASLNAPAPPEPLLAPLPVYTVPPEAWRAAAPKSRPGRVCHPGTPAPSPWPWLVLIILLANKMNGSA